MKRPTQWKLSNRSFATISFSMGVVLLGVLLCRIGLAALLRDLREAGPYVFWIFLVSGLRYILRSIGWAAAFLPGEQQGTSGLLGRQLAGDALAYVSLAGPFLGEPLKAGLVRDVDFDASLGSTMLENFIYTLTALALSVSGIVLLVFVPFANESRANILAVAVLLASFLAVLAVIVWKRFTLPKVLSWIGRKTGTRWRQLRDRLETIAARMDQVKEQRPLALYIIFLLAITAQLLMLVEVALVLWPLGISFSVASLLVIESATKLAKTAFFFIPGRVGADEGSSAGIVSLLGMGPSIGITISLLRRLRALLWTLVGLAFLAYHTLRVRSDSARSGV